MLIIVIACFVLTAIPLLHCCCVYSANISMPLIAGFSTFGVNVILSFPSVTTTPLYSRWIALYGPPASLKMSKSFSGFYPCTANEYTRWPTPVIPVKHSAKCRRTVYLPLGRLNS